MKTARDLIDELNAADEHVGIEAKRGREIGKSILETVCAFANEPGLGGKCRCGYLKKYGQPGRFQRRKLEILYRHRPSPVPNGPNWHLPRWRMIRTRKSSRKVRGLVHKGLGFTHKVLGLAHKVLGFGGLRIEPVDRDRLELRATLELTDT